MINQEMWHVYILRSRKTNSFSIGMTKNLTHRIDQHNNGKNQSTEFGIPWDLEAYVTVKTSQNARRLERYFKTGSGKAVLRKRILGDVFEKEF